MEALCLHGGLSSGCGVQLMDMQPLCKSDRCMLVVIDWWGASAPSPSL